MSRLVARPYVRVLNLFAFSTVVGYVGRLIAALFLIAGILQGNLAIGAPTSRFISLGSLGGEQFRSFASAVSSDGSTVVGNSNAEDKVEAFIWTEETGMVSLGSVNANGVTRALSVSSDGMVVAGTTYASLNSYTQADPFLFDRDNGFSELFGCGCHTSLGTVSISGNGQVIAGSRPAQIGGFNAYVWTAERGPVDLGDFPGGNSFSIALDISEDGQTIVGSGSVPGGQRGFKWTMRTGMVDLGELMNSAYAVSSDGTAIAGLGYLDGQGAVRWTEEEGAVWLGHLPGLHGIRASFANGISGDGTVIVGGSGGDYDFQAFRWTAESGMRSVQGILEQLGHDMTGWKLGPANDVSADGTVIVGSGVNPDGNTEGWVAVIPATYVPEPGSAVSLFTGAAVFISCWRPRRLHSE